MTETEWLDSLDPLALLDFLHGQDRTSRRKIVLFGVACCRWVWKLIPEEPFRRAVEVAAALADGDPNADRDRAFQEVIDWEELAEGAAFFLLDAAGCNTSRIAWEAIREVVLQCAHAQAVEDTSTAGEERNVAIEVELNVHALHLREIVGNPFRPIVLDPFWLTWHDGTVPNLARSIYDERAFDRLPILADALEDAGCTVAALLDHLRAKGTHERGCWAIDLLLARE